MINQFFALFSVILLGCVTSFSNEVVLPEGVSEPLGIFALIGVDHSGKELSAGTSFLVSSKQGLLVTNNHAIFLCESQGYKKFYITIGNNESGAPVRLPVRVVARGFPEGVEFSSQASLRSGVSPYTSFDNNVTTIRDYVVLKADIEIQSTDYIEFAPIFINPLALVRTRELLEGNPALFAGRQEGEFRLWNANDTGIGKVGLLSYLEGPEKFWNGTVISEESANFRALSISGGSSLDGEVPLKQGLLGLFSYQQAVDGISGGPVFSTYGDKERPRFSYGVVVGYDPQNMVGFNLKQRKTNETLLFNKANFVIPYGLASPVALDKPSLKKALIDSTSIPFDRIEHALIRGGGGISVQDYDALEKLAIIDWLIEKQSDNRFLRYPNIKIFVSELKIWYEDYIKSGLSAVGGNANFISFEQEWFCLQNLLDYSISVDLYQRVFDLSKRLEEITQRLKSSGGRGAAYKLNGNQARELRSEAYRYLAHPLLVVAVPEKIRSSFVAKLMEFEIEQCKGENDYNYLRFATIYLIDRGRDVEVNLDDLYVFGVALKKVGLRNEGDALLDFYVYKKEVEWTREGFNDSMKLFKRIGLSSILGLNSDWDANVKSGEALFEVCVKKGIDRISIYALFLALDSVTIVQ